MITFLFERRLFLILICLFITYYSNAQHVNINKPCGTDEIHKQLMINDPIVRFKHNKSEEVIREGILLKRKLKTTGPSDYTIPIVVHVIHDGGLENISDAQVLAGVQHLNDAFNNSGSYDTTLGIATGIQFCLAKQDELGNASSGIIRIQSTLTNVLSPSEDLALKNNSRWDPTKYLNIWIVKEVTTESSGPGVAGYAYFPSAHGSLVDGVVCEANYFGASLNNSKILVHEVGHYLGLYHTFEGGCKNDNCLTDGDRVCDTPPDASSAAVVCGFPVNSCISDVDDQSINNPFRPTGLGGVGDRKDMTSNYMDYGSTMCQVLFTDGQKERMANALTTIRESLLESIGCNDLCPSPIQISFTPDDTAVFTGANVLFINTTTGASSYEWSINGLVFSTAQNPSYTFNQQGSQQITLVASNGNIVCREELSIVVEVNCTVQATFSGLAKVKPGVSVVYTNNTVGANSYQWFVDGISVGVSQNFTHAFSSVGGFVVSLVVSNGICYDTAQKFIQVGDCISENQGNIWYFGNWAGVDFSGDEPVPIYFPIVFPQIFLRSDEACVSMSDPSGNFLFFANPNYVFNRNLLQMANGSGLLGNWSATQMAVVQNPGNTNRHYLFTLDALGGADGLRYSEIDMSLDGGLGDVVAATKNTFLRNSLTEKISSVKHANGIDSWIIVHEYNSNIFYAYQVSGIGVSGSPVISNVGYNHVQDLYNLNTLGQLKISPDGCKIALAVHGMGMIELFNFDNQTGVISSPITFSAPEYLTCYGVEFSPDGSKLYVSAEFSKSIYQFDLNAGSPSEISSSRVLVGSGGAEMYVGALQLGPLGKIYLARAGAPFLGVINKPNIKGVGCEFVLDGVSLGARIGSHSLPAFNQSYFSSPQPSIAGPDTVCINAKNVKYRISNSTCSSSINVWTVLGKGVIVSSNDTLATIDFNEAGIDTLIVERTAFCGKVYDTIYVVVKPLPDFDISDTTQCTSSAIVLDAGSGFTSYLWQDNSTLQTFSASSAGKYWVTVSTAGGCVMTDSINVIEPDDIELSLGSDITNCIGAVTLLDAGSGFTSYLWQDNSREQTYTSFLSGIYWVEVADVCGNVISDTIEIISNGSIKLNLGDDLALCPEESIELNVGNSYQSYLWQDGYMGNTFLTSDTGMYWVMVADYSGCLGSDSLQIERRGDCCNEVDIPNLFTPNKDGQNDKFVIGCIDRGVWLLEVYNRWGDLVYKSIDYQNDWTGNEISDGVYYYLLSKEDSKYRGWVQIIR